MGNFTSLMHIVDGQIPERQKERNVYVDIEFLQGGGNRNCSLVWIRMSQCIFEILSKRYVTGHRY
jgi:hypothetical protein